MTKKSCYYGNGRAAACDHRDQSKTSKGGEEETKQAAKKTKAPWKKRYLTFLSRFQSKVKHKIKLGDAKAKRCSPGVLEECGNLVRVLRRATAGCLTAAVAAIASGAGDEDGLPSYVQLDQVSYGVRREAFGPVYLVT